MKGTFRFSALVTIILASQMNCVRILSSEDLNITTTTTPTSETSTGFDSVSESSNIQDIPSESLKMESRGIDSDYDTTTPLSSTTDRIPPTLLNTKIEFARDSSEKPGKSLKDYATPTISQFHSTNMGQSIDARVKQALLNSKQNAFKNLNMFNSQNDVKPTESLDQVAKSNEVKNDISKENPKDFLPSPEVSPLYNRENQVQDHFAPMNQYYRPVKQDARYPPESTFSSNPMLDTRWLGGNRPPSQLYHPLDFMRPPSLHQHYQPSPQTLHQQGRNTNIEDPYHHSQPHPQFFHNMHNIHRHFQNEDRVKFPSNENLSGEKNSNWASPNQVPALIYKKPKGTWKWIPDDESEDKLTFQGSEPSSPLSHETGPQTTRDRPYSFISHELNSYGHYLPSSTAFSDESKPNIPTGPAAWPSSGSETLQTTEEYASLKNEEPKIGNIDVKHSRHSPWKKILHVMTAAIPIGLIISALTPRIVYVHPNATVPVFQQQLPNGNTQFPNQQYPNTNQGLPSGQVNGPFPNRQRAVVASNELIDQSLTTFLKTMEAQFSERVQKQGDKLNGDCEDRFFCEVALTGRMPKADGIHRMLYNVALETPDEQAKNSGLGEIFTAIKRQNCDVFNCTKINH